MWKSLSAVVPNKESMLLWDQATWPTSISHSYSKSHGKCIKESKCFSEVFNRSEYSALILIC